MPKLPRKWPPMPPPVCKIEFVCVCVCMCEWDGESVTSGRQIWVDEGQHRVGAMDKASAAGQVRHKLLTVLLLKGMCQEVIDTPAAHQRLCPPLPPALDLPLAALLMPPPP